MTLIFSTYYNDLIILIKSLTYLYIYIYVVILVYYKELIFAVYNNFTISLSWLSCQYVIYQLNVEHLWKCLIIDILHVLR